MRENKVPISKSYAYETLLSFIKMKYRDSISIDDKLDNILYFPCLIASKDAIFLEPYE